MRRAEGSPFRRAGAGESPGPVRGQGGFTILEIMIATAVLTLGLVGVLALFPVAIHYGKQIIERSTAVVIAESVSEAIREGIRNNLRSVTRNNTTHHYFVFKHDGVKDAAPRSRELERPDKDYYILLPRYKTQREGVFSSREAALA
ncbi:MAG: prepilin-type N-terminal cleavage/methylation domain-containing protein, partial [Planctomycetes bacterium]|nr:prepilin-type N-terminal cleavage/methylation domain-containing protein [Planctomycetota bacterium]